MSDEPQFWFNTKTGEVEEGHKSSWTHLMGPYATRAEAEHAIDRAKSRNEAWEEQDDEWRSRS